MRWLRKNGYVADWGRCEGCGVRFRKATPKTRFCTRSCSNAYNFRPDNRAKGNAAQAEAAYRRQVRDLAQLLDAGPDFTIHTWLTIRGGSYVAACRALARARHALGLEIPCEQPAVRAPFIYHLTQKDRALLRRLEAALLRTEEEEACSEKRPSARTAGSAAGTP